MANATERAIRRKRKRAAAAAAKPPRDSLIVKRKKREQQRHQKDQRRTLSASNPNLTPLGGNATLFEAKALESQKKKEKRTTEKEDVEEEEGDEKKKKEAEEIGKDTPLLLISTLPAAQQLRFFLAAFQTASGSRFSSLELEAFEESCMVKVGGGGDLCGQVKGVFRGSWKEDLCGGEVGEGKVEPGSPRVLVVSASAIRTLELLRDLRKLTRVCKPAKLFAKHMKVEEQVQFLKDRVNIAGGTPNRLKKLADIDALDLSRLGLVVLDMQRDAKGYSLFTLPQVCTEFWDLYKSHLHERLLQGELRICFYGSTSAAEFEKALNSMQ